MNSTLRAALAAAALAFAGAAAAQAWPARPIKIIVPYPAGGLSDFQVRAMAEPLGRALGQPIVVDNKPGASGAIGTQATATAPGDGYTFVFVNNGLVITPHLNKQAGYDALKDLAPVTTVTNTPMVMVVHPSVPANSVKEFIDWARAQPRGVEYGSAGTASFGHMATVQFQQATGLNLVHVPYKGEAPMTMAVRGGEVKFLITSPSASMLNAVKEGKLKLLGVASRAPAPLLPGVKLISDTVPNFTAEVWFGVLAPASTPPAIVNRMNEAIVKVLDMQDIKEKFAGVGALTAPSSPQVFARDLRAESQRWGELIGRTGIKAE